MFPSLREASFIETLRQLSGHARDPPIGRPSAEHAPCSGSYRKKARTDSGLIINRLGQQARNRSGIGALMAPYRLAQHSPRPRVPVKTWPVQIESVGPHPPRWPTLFSFQSWRAAVWQDHVHRESDDDGKQDCHDDTQDPSTALVALGIVGLAVIRLVYSHGGRTLEASRRPA